MYILDFIKFAHDNSDDFINYLEAIMDARGMIYLVCPSHMQTIIDLAEKQHNINYLDEFGVDESPIHILVSKYNYISIWYDNIMIHKINRLQERSLKLLKKYKLLSNDCNVTISNEYDNYLYRKSLFTNNTNTLEPISGTE